MTTDHRTETVFRAADVEAMGPLAARAAAVAQSHAVAIAEERAAAGELLARAIELCTPALPALASRLLLSADTQVGAASAREVWSETPAFVLAGSLDPTGHMARAPHERSARSGAYKPQRALLAFADGRLARANRRGVWSEEPDGWCVVGTAIEELSPRAAADEFDVVAALARLREALERVANGRANERAAEARARADELRAATARLGKGR